MNIAIKIKELRESVGMTRKSLQNIREFQFEHWKIGKLKEEFHRHMFPDY